MNPQYIIMKTTFQYQLQYDNAFETRYVVWLVTDGIARAEIKHFPTEEKAIEFVKLLKGENK